MRGVAATVTLVTTSDAAGRPSGLTVTAFESVSMDPPTVLVCINRKAGICPALLESGRFCVNVLAAGQERLARAFGGALQGEERFTVGRWSCEGHSVPYLADAQSNVFCAIEKLVEVATHTIVIARVTSVRNAGDAAPLAYLDGRYAAVEIATLKTKHGR